MQKVLALFQDSPTSNRQESIALDRNQSISHSTHSHDTLPLSLSHVFALLRPIFVSSTLVVPPVTLGNALNSALVGIVVTLFGRHSQAKALAETEDEYQVVHFFP